MEANDKKMPYGVLNADCLEAMKKLPDNFIDAVVTDPPYGLSFMGKDWDYGVPGVAFWKEALRITKPGGHIVAFGGSRTYHRLTCAIEDAGWEIRDCLGWLYSSGFPKSMDISKAIDKKLGAVRATRGGVGDHEGMIDFGMKNRCPNCGKPFFSANPCTCPRDDLIPITEEAKKWSGWGTCLKPAFEPIILARKPVEGTVSDNVMKWGVGGINIDECRIPSDEPVVVHSPAKETLYDSGHSDMGTWVDNRGRFPANIIHDGSEEVLEVFPDNVKGGTWNRTKGARHFNNNGKPTEFENHGSDKSVGSAARFFYCAKASKKEKNNNCERMLTWEKDQELTQLIEKSNQLLKGISESTMQNLVEIECNMTLFGKDTTEQYQKECKSTISMVIKLITELKTSSLCQHLNTNDYILDVIRMNEDNGISVVQLAEKLSQLMVVSMNDEVQSALNVVNVLLNALVEIRNCAKQGNRHPTVKPIALMEYLVRLITPSGGTVLDPFMGSGSTGIAALNLGRKFIGIEKEAEYFNIAKKRLEEAFLNKQNDV